MAQRPTPYHPPIWALFTMLGLAIGLLAGDVVDAYGGGEAGLPPPAHAAARDDRPVEVDARAVLELPTPTPTPEPTATPIPTPGAALTPPPVTCGMVTQEAGDVCRMPASTPTPTPKLPACWSTEAVDGELCMIRPTATSVPTSAPPPAPPTKE